MELNDPEGLEEERRLFYVALTRARRSLTIYIPVRYYHRPSGRDDTHGYGTQSRFLTSQAEALCERIDAYATGEQRLPDDHTAAAPVKVQVDLSNLWR